MTEHRSLVVPDALVGQRVDAAMVRLLGISRTQAAAWIAAGAVRLDGHAVTKSDRMQANSWLEVELQPRENSTATEPVAEGLEVIFDDDDIVVVDKPVGIAAHSSPGWSGPTVSGSLAAAGYRISTSGAPERQGIVQRLDVGTSGLMVVAKSERAYSVLKQAFRDRRIDKTYHALVQGHPDPLTGTIDAPIGRHPVADHRYAVMVGGRRSITHYETLEAFTGACLVEIHLETGRTHQIRVHFSALKHPCVGDLTYGADPVLAKRLSLTRQWLHAMHLGFEHPVTGDRVDFDSTYPADLHHALHKLRAT